MEVSMATARSLVPFDEDGQPTSIGSIGHAEGVCQAACAFMLRARGCLNGIECRFCHFSHDMKRSRQRHKGRQRPCKGKRDKYRNYWEKLKSEIEEDPENFDPDTVELPPSISTDEKLREKLVARLKTYRNNVLAGGDGADADSQASESANENSEHPVSLPGETDLARCGYTSGRHADAKQAGDELMLREGKLGLYIRSPDNSSSHASSTTRGGDTPSAAGSENSGSERRLDQERGSDYAKSVPMKVELTSFEPPDMLSQKVERLSEMQDVLQQLTAARVRQQSYLIGNQGAQAAAPPLPPAPSLPPARTVPPQAASAGNLSTAPNVDEEAKAYRELTELLEKAMKAPGTPSIAPDAEKLLLLQRIQKLMQQVQNSSSENLQVAAATANVTVTRAMLSMVAKQAAASWQQRQMMLMSQQGPAAGMQLPPYMPHSQAMHMWAPWMSTPDAGMASMDTPPWAGAQMTPDSRGWPEAVVPGPMPNAAMEAPLFAPPGISMGSGNVHMSAGYKQAPVQGASAHGAPAGYAGHGKPWKYGNGGQGKSGGRLGAEKRS